ncbi:DUF4303 domain-containing protein [Bradyrhizobium sp. SHOUNA76]|uniref:DUF4303 domain-containing protein n=1 Tax=Bradyrhizobium sp. SHOUNA76 TaxID=2908927 RepID=UPI001FF6A232|nr:DUF4303 domain-containing protein [Bradyrhizobium sp. SHOUNA76]MCJ9701845.1 DUF4303 domain-containing protein [Bradyrhizobium sp. SHOUNA76]
MDWHAKVEKLRTATIATVDALTSLLKGQRLYAICLQTADDGMSVGLCANTEEGYAEKRASEAEIEDMTPQYSAYLRWAPAEWRYEIFGDDHFADINRDLIAAGANSNRDFSIYFDHLIDAMIHALAHLRAERAQALEGVTLFVTISDSEEAEAVERRSANRLNPPTLAGEFGRPLD